jgi:hypothetical protein
VEERRRRGEGVGTAQAKLVPCSVGVAQASPDCCWNCGWLCEPIQEFHLCEDVSEAVWQGWGCYFVLRQGHCCFVDVLAWVEVVSFGVEAEI